MKIINKNFLILFLLVFSSCCITKNRNYKEQLKLGKQFYSVELQTNKHKKTVIENGLVSKEYRFNYENSSIVFFTNDKSGSGLFFKFLQQKDYLILIDEDNPKYIFYEKDKVFYMIKNKGIIYGYVNVDINQKEYFDKIITSLKKLNR